MRRRKHMPWCWLILSTLRDDETTLEEVYISIEEMHHDLEAQDRTEMINPHLLEVDLRYGDRPKLTHSVRTHLTSSRKQAG